MRHRITQHKLNRTSEHRKAMMRNMAQNMIEHGRITTTVPKAKNLRPFLEKLVTKAVHSRRFTEAGDTAGALRARRAIHKALGDRSLIPKDHQETYDGMSDAMRKKTLRMVSGRRYRTGEPKGRLGFTGESITHRLIETIAPRFSDRPGGYVRLVLLPKRRVGDHAALAMLQFVGDEEVPVSLTKPGKTSRKRKADGRYGMAIKEAKSWAKKERTSAKKDKTESKVDSEATASADEEAKSGDES